MYNRFEYTWMTFKRQKTKQKLRQPIGKPSLTLNTSNLEFHSISDGGKKDQLSQENMYWITNAFTAKRR